MLTGYRHMRCGLIGEKLGHSFSPQIHEKLCDYDYRLFELPDEAAVGEFLRQGDFDALNVTIPYKQTVIPYLSGMTDEARRIGAVNTIRKTADGSLSGYNTDYYGFSALIRTAGIRMKGRKVLVLGSGGASRTARTVCADLGADPVIVISRSGPDNYDNLERHRDAQVIVNCTPVGMFPHNGVSPVDLSLFPYLEGVLDMIYNPAVTALLYQAQSRGIPCANGLTMLVAQAIQSCGIFLDKTIPESEIGRITGLLQKQMGNIVLVGMPGSGKSTVACLLADRTGRTVLDTDALITKETGRTPADWIREEGEAAFRGVESACVAEAGKRSGIILATGGGVVTRKENYLPLHQNGRIYFLDRDPEDLPLSGRPLSQLNGVMQLYRERLPLYRSFADCIIANRGTPEEAARQILEDYSS